MGSQYYKSETTQTDSSHRNRERITFSYFSFNVGRLVSFDMIILSIEIIIGVCVSLSGLFIFCALSPDECVCQLLLSPLDVVDLSNFAHSRPSPTAVSRPDFCFDLISCRGFFFYCGWWRRDVAMNLTLCIIHFFSLTRLISGVIQMRKVIVSLWPTGVPCNLHVGYMDTLVECLRLFLSTTWERRWETEPRHPFSPSVSHPSFYFFSSKLV